MKDSEVKPVSRMPVGFVLAFTAVTAVLAAGGFWFYRSQEGEIRNEADNSLRMIARLKAEQVAEWRAERLLDANLLMENPFIAREIAGLLKSPGAADAGPLLGYFGAFSRFGGYRDVILSDSSGRILLSKAGRTGSIHAPAMEALSMALRDRRSVLSDLHAGPGDLPVHIDTVAPLDLAGAGLEGRQAAILLQMEAGTHLYPLIQAWPVASESGESLMVRRDGDSVLFLNELRHKSGTALNLRVPLSRTDVPAVKAVLGTDGIVDGRDYRGVPVISALVKIPDSPWFLISKIDNAEALAGWRFRSVLIISIVLALMLTTIAIAQVLWNRGASMHYRLMLKAEQEKHNIEEQFRSLSKSAQDAIVMMDDNGLITFFSDAAEKMFRRSRESVTGMDCHELLAPPPKRAVFLTKFRHWRETGEGDSVGRTGETTALREDGSEFPVEISMSSAKINERWSAIAIIRDITEKKRAGEELRQANEKLLDMVSGLEKRNARNHVLVEMREFLQACSNTSEIGPVITGSMPRIYPESLGALFLLNSSKSDLESAARWGGYPEGLDDNLFAPDECWGLRRGGLYVVDGASSGIVCPHLKNVPSTVYACLPLMSKGDVLGLLHVNMRDEAGRDPRAFAAEIRETAGTLSEILSLSISNIRLRETLSLQAIRDPLTGLHNRRFMEESFVREVVRAGRRQSPLGVIMADIDHFKKFNDTYGHAAGDAVLSEIARFLTTNLRGGDIICRYGGEEFALILPESNLENTVMRAKQLVAGVRSLKIKRKSQVLGQTTFSMGVAAFPDHGAGMEDLLRAADAALYRAKMDGRDRVAAAGIA